MSEKFYTVLEVANILGASRWQVLHWLREGRLNGFQLSRQTYRIGQKDLDGFIRAARIKGGRQ